MTTDIPTMKKAPSFTTGHLDEASLQKIARIMAPWTQAGDILTLKGTLGAGKTTFARAFIQQLSGAEIFVPSPTYTLLQTYDCGDHPLIFHYDFYRLNDPAEVWELDFDTALENITLIEWPEKGEGYFLEATLQLSLLPMGDERQLTLIPPQTLDPVRWESLMIDLGAFRAPSPL